MKNSAKLIVGSTATDMDLFYRIGVSTPTPMIYVETAKIKFALVSPLEYGLMRDKAKKGVTVLPIGKYHRPEDQKKGRLALSRFLKEKGITNLIVSKTKFPGYLAESLRGRRFHIEYKAPLIKGREIKSVIEIKSISHVQRVLERAVDRAVKIIKKSKIGKKNNIYYKNKPLASENLKTVISMELLKYGCIDAEESIISCGQDTAQPHNFGAGLLKAHQPIIIDIFPRSKKTMYFADMTRTVCKGKAPKELKDMYGVVKSAQEEAMKMVKPGVNGRDIHKFVEDFFKDHGFKTAIAREKGQKDKGFIHALGHGIGLELHEYPRLTSAADSMLRIGHVFTIEPGLYYPGLGGVRIEDIIVVTKKGFRNLTKYPKQFEI